MCDAPQKTYNKEYAAANLGVGNQGQTLGNISRFTYENFMKSTPMYVTTLFAIAVIGDVMFDGLTDRFWAYHNKGKLFDEVIPVQFPNLPPGCEDDDEDEDEDEDE